MGDTVLRYGSGSGFRRTRVGWPQQFLRTSGTSEHEWHPSACAHRAARNEPGRFSWELHTGRVRFAEEITMREKPPEVVVKALLRLVV